MRDGAYMLAKGWGEGRGGGEQPPTRKGVPQPRSRTLTAATYMQMLAAVDVSSKPEDAARMSTKSCKFPGDPVFDSVQ
jgi:hypothetical protein